MIKISRFLLLVFIVTSCSQKKALLEKSKTAQEELNKEFRDSSTSPLPEEDLKDFQGLDFFPLDKDYIVEGKVKKTPDEASFSIPTSDPAVEKEYVKYGEAHFTFQGDDYTLNLYEPKGGYDDPEYEDYLFVPFTDLTNAKDTYEAGRYLDIEKPGGNTLIIDFNQAYNPYCAYAAGYSCPIPPEGNNLDVAIKAGVKAYHPDS